MGRSSSQVAAATARAGPGDRWLYGLWLVTAGVTAFYMFRLYFRIFRGRSRVPHELRDHIDDPPGLITVPLYILGFFCVFAGFAGLPQAWGDLIGAGVEGSNSLGNFIAPVLAGEPERAIEHATEYRLAGVATATSVLGMFVAWWLYMRRRTWPEAIVARLPRLHRLLVDKLRIDEVYDAVLVRPLVAFSNRVLYRGVDAGLIDGVGVNGLARGIRAVAAHGLKYAQNGLAQSYLLVISAGAVALVVYLLRATGS